MITLEFETIRSAVNKGTMIKLFSDYRMASRAKAFLPKNTACVMSIASFRQHIQNGQADKMYSRIDGLCVWLGEILRSGVSPQNSALKLEWYEPEQYWVVMLPNEQLRSAPNRALQPAMIRELANRRR